MKISSIIVGSVLVGVSVFGIGAPAEAYEAKAIALSPTHTLFVTTYTETLLNRDGIIPMSAKLGAEGTHNPLVASFQVAGKSRIAFMGKDLGSIILSGGPIAHGGYTINEGEKTTVMLISLISHDTSFANDVRASLTSLPILITENGEVKSQAMKTYVGTGISVITTEVTK